VQARRWCPVDRGALGANAGADVSQSVHPWEEPGTATYYGPPCVRSPHDGAAQDVAMPGQSSESLKSLESYACLESPESSSRGWPITSPKRGNNRQNIFFTDDDRRFYIATLREQMGENRVSLLAWCLMANQVHLVLVPKTADGLELAVGRTHWRYTQAINRLHQRVIGVIGAAISGRAGSSRARSTRATWLRRCATWSAIPSERGSSDWRSVTHGRVRRPIVGVRGEGAARAPVAVQRGEVGGAISAEGVAGAAAAGARRDHRRAPA